MKLRSLVLVLGLLVTLTLGAGEVFAGSGVVSLDKVEGLLGHDTVVAGENLRFVMRFDNSGTNGTAVKCNTSSGWVISSPDGAIWDSVTLDSAGPINAGESQFFLYFNVVSGLGFFNVGNGAPTPDTVGALQAASGTKGLPTTWNDTSLAVRVWFTGTGSHGKHICIDTAFWGTGGTWKWVGVVSLADFFPTWQGLPGLTYNQPGGGYCFLIYDAAAGVDDANGATLPKSFALQQNYPNPFNPTTTVKFDVPTRSQVKLSVYNVLGQKVKTLVDGMVEAGFGHEARWDGTTDGGNAVSSGIYFYKMEAGSFVQTKKMVMMK
ncbi:hypothetical protein C3F09_08010 [candidate division GN15 bacterium]|uniref:FlgD/Vpr Ig-like domain-containing protein n=1 Tax=candidate division GN15 bacterium TaxID=2072418 RepID=A0A855WZI4_9BACT|nr:MAG: hypothetical protein C3F09_08010 [candidate division GN15 bacterium]